MTSYPDITENLPHFLPARCIESAKPLRFDKGDHLFRDGDPVTSLFYLVEGGVKAVRYPADGTEVIMFRATAGEFFAESGIVLSHYTCDAIAEQSSCIASIPLDAVKDELGDAGSFALGLFLQVARNARKQCSRYERLRLKRAQDRVMHYLFCETGSAGVLEISTTLSDFAGELGLEPETLYRTLGELEKAGKLQKQGRSIRLLHTP